MKTAKALLTALAIGALSFGALSAVPSAALAQPGKEGTRANEVANERAKERSAKGDKAKVGEKAPNFTLTDVNGKTFTLADATKQGKIVVLEWFNPECPAVVKHHQNHPTFKNLAAEFQGKDVVMVAINSGAPGKQGYGKEKNIEAAKKFGMNYPILMDSDGKVGRMYGARTTPHMFVIDKTGVLAYAGAIDNDRGRNPGDINYVSVAVNELLAGQTVSTPETQAYGCSVKYAD